MGDSSAILTDPTPGEVGRDIYLPAPLIFVLASVSLYGGAAVAVSLFAYLPPHTVAWWRILVGAVVIIPLTRPWKAKLSVRDWVASGLFGIYTASMNLCFYEAVSRIPLGTAVSLEFLGPVIVAIIAGRGWRLRVAAVLALAGVFSIGGIGVNLGEVNQLVGTLFALASGGFWALYIVSGRRIAAQRSGVTSLGIGLMVGAVVFLPLAAPTLGGAWVSPWVLAAVLAVGILSSAVPFALEQVAMKRLGAAVFALMASLEPATSMVIGVVVLKQIPNFGEMFGLFCISVAVVLSSWNPSMRLVQLLQRRGGGQLRITRAGTEPPRPRK